MTNWKEYKLSDLMDVIGGGTPKTKIPEYWDGDIPWLSVVDFGNSEKKVFDTEKKITDLGLNNSSTKILKKGQIIISARGTVGELAVLGRDMAFNQSCYGLNAKSEICTNDFLYYLMKNKISELKRNAHGAVFDTITRNTFDTVFASVPNIDTQTAIAEILSSLDDKIELNNKINQELENLAQTLFKQWFIDFEFHCLPENYKFSGAVKPLNFESIMTYKRVGGLPVPDGKSWFVYILLCDDNSFYKGMTNDLYRRFYEHYTGVGAEHTKKHKPIKVIHWEQLNTKEDAAKREQELKTGYGRTWINRQVEKAGGIEALKKGLPALQEAGGSPALKTQLRMAGEMVDSELGEIPKGWVVKKLGDITEISSSKRIFRNEYVECGIPFFRGKEITELDRSNKISTELFISEERYKEIKSKFGVPKIGDILITSVGTIGNTYLINYEFDFYFKDGNVTWIKDYLSHLSSSFIFTWLRSYETQSNIKKVCIGSTQQALTITALNNLKIISPPKVLSCEFTTVVDSLFEQISSNKNENQELTNLRDTLLPKLISGELEVAEVNSLNLDLQD